MGFRKIPTHHQSFHSIKNFTFANILIIYISFSLTHFHFILKKQIPSYYPHFRDEKTDCSPGAETRLDFVTFSTSSWFHSFTCPIKLILELIISTETRSENHSQFFFNIHGTIPHTQRKVLELFNFFWVILCCCSITKLCPIFCNPTHCSTPGSSVLHPLPGFAQIYVHWVSDAI